MNTHSPTDRIVQLHTAPEQLRLFSDDQPAEQLRLAFDDQPAAD